MLPLSSLRFLIFTFSFTSHSFNDKAYSFHLIQFWVPCCIVSSQGRGSLCVLHRQVTSALGTRWKNGLQHLLLFPELPAGSPQQEGFLFNTCYSQRLCSLPYIFEQTHPFRACVGTGFMPTKNSPQGSALPPHSPWKPWDFLNAVQSLCKSVWL